LFAGALTLVTAANIAGENIVDDFTQEGRLLELFTPLGKDQLLIHSLEVSEGLSSLFEMHVEVLHDNAKPFKASEILGKPVTIQLNQNPSTGNLRYFSGIVNRLSQGDAVEWFSFYYLTVVPHVWLLTQRKQSRIFMDVSVPDILKQVLDGFTLKVNLGGTYKPRTYCVQYAETDWDFASRLMEEEGIFYYFVHEDGTDKLLLGDAPAHHFPCPDRSEYTFRSWRTGGEDFDDNPIQSFVSDFQLQTGKVTFWDHNFQMPKQNFKVEQIGNFPSGDSHTLESYLYPGGYAKKFDGVDRTGGDKDSDLQNIFEERTLVGKNVKDSIDSTYSVSKGTSVASLLTPGYRFTLSNHLDPDVNGEYVLTAVQHSVKQTPDYVSNEPVAAAYANSFECIPYAKQDAPPFRPLRRTPRPIIYGTQTATVVGKDGDEISTDKYGRVKVQFHWDRYGQNDLASSAWVRVAQGWAGNKWGMMFIPRIGMEVVIQFLEGDPDQPIITGCVYNAMAMPPYTLPDNKTRSTIKSNSSLGGSGFNEFRFEDKAGEEQIFIHAQKDEDIKVLHDCKESIDNDRHLTVGTNQYELVKSDKHMHVTGDHKEKVDGSISRHAQGAIQEKTDQRYAMDAAQEVHIKAGMTCIIEAGVQLSLKVGGSFIDINPGAVTISGAMVMINSGGSAGSGSGSSPDSPTDAKPSADDKSGEVTKAPDPPSEKPDKYSPNAAAMVAAAQSGAAFARGGGGGGGAPEAPQLSDAQRAELLGMLE